jgi:murein DD-endopeptidase MepM/ murein hydrolase activator NlpD
VRRVFVALGILLSCCLAEDASGARPQLSPPGQVRAPQYFPPLDRPPLDPPLRLSGSFGEYRPGHFHAGLDFATGGQVGLPVYASLPGSVVRVRASGVGYGRSVYLQADDGRLLVYGHLDAFDEPLASYVAAVQDSASTSRTSGRTRCVSA